MDLNRSVSLTGSADQIRTFHVLKYICGLIDRILPKLRRQYYHCSIHLMVCIYETLYCISHVNRSPYHLHKNPFSARRYVHLCCITANAHSLNHNHTFLLVQNIFLNSNHKSASPRSPNHCCRILLLPRNNVFFHCKSPIHCNPMIWSICLLKDSIYLLIHRIVPILHNQSHSYKDRV